MEIMNVLSDVYTEMRNFCFYTVDLEMLPFDGKRCTFIISVALLFAPRIEGLRI
jgi:hypothetical protein